MKNIKPVQEYYKNQTAQSLSKLDIVKSRIRQIAMLRLFLILLMIVPFIIYGINYISIACCILCIIFFMLFVKKHDSYFNRKLYLEKKLRNFGKEQECLNLNFSSFDSGKEFIDTSHEYSHDLDLFGDKSIFQAINRTTNAISKNNLKNRFLNPFRDPNQIIDTQEAVKELAENPDFLFRFIAKGESKDKDFNIVKYLKHFLENPPFSGFWKYIQLIPLIVIVGLVWGAVYLNFPTSLLIIGYFFLMFLSMIPMKIIHRKTKEFDQFIESLKSYLELLKTVEQQNFEAKQLNKIKNSLFHEEIKASSAIKKLEQLSNNLTLSQTILGLTILNPFFMWNVFYGLKLEKWIKAYHTDIQDWITSIADIDSLVSFAIFSFNHPNYIFPLVSPNRFCLEGKEIGHPMMDPFKCVTNAIDINENPHFLIITGANMAGKSTYLRTISCNLLLAEMGLPVYASEFRFYPFKLITNLRTSDSLADNESYFFSELKKLKMIIDELQSKEKIFIVLDEILKGTNSEDKQKGSSALMKQLLKNDGYGIIATHDLILGKLEDSFPSLVKNYRFEGEIQNQELYFSYKLQAGVAQNMNACFLMKKMGITGL